MVEVLVQGIRNAAIAAGLIVGLMAFLSIVVVTIISEEMRRAVFKILIWVTIILVVLIPVGVIYRFSTGPSVFTDSSPEEIRSILIDASRTIALVMAPIGLGILTIVSSRAFSPQARRLFFQYAQRRYLKTVIKVYQNAATVPLWFEYLKISPDRLTHNLLLSGAPGIGQTTLLKQVVVWLAQLTLAGKSDVLPVYIDLNLAFNSARPRARSSDRWFRPSADTSWSTRWLLQQAAEDERICFVLDLAVPLPSKWYQLEAEHLIDVFIRHYASCQFILTLSPPFENFRFTRHFSDRQSLTELPNILIQEFCQAMIGAQAGVFFYQKLRANHTWLALARRPFLLNLLAQYFAAQKQLPSNLIDLFRATSYPVGDTAIDQLEEILAEAAVTLVESHETGVSLKSIKQSLEKGSRPDQPARIKTTIARLRHITPVTTRFDLRHVQTMLYFRHPLYLSFFVALAWRQRSALLDGDTLYEVIENPLLGEAFIFFNNLEVDRALVDAHIAQIANRGDLGSLVLAVGSFLAKPEVARSDSLSKRLSEQLVRQIAYADSQILPRLWSLLSTWKSEERTYAYLTALPKLDAHMWEAALIRVGKFSVDDLGAIFRQTNDNIGRMAGVVFCELNPDQALAEFVKIHRDGPNNKRKPAIAAMGLLPFSSGVSNTLLTLLQEERDPELRLEILKSFERSGSQSTITLLSVVANSIDDVAVRAYAAGMLQRSLNPDLRTEDAIEGLMRAVRGQIPAQVKTPLEQLLHQLRQSVPDVVERVEISLNPYVVGKPVDDSNMFFGREEILLELKNAVRSGNNFLIYGARRIGKTSILQQLLQYLQSGHQTGNAYAAVYITLEGLAQQEFFARIIREICKRDVIPGLTCEEPSEEHNYTYWQFNKDLGVIIQELKDAYGPESKLVLLLDEVDVLMTYPQQMHSLLRRTMGADYKDNLVVILAGMNPVPKWERVESPFYNLFTWRGIEPLREDAARSLITQPVAGTCIYEPAAVNQILQYTSNRPFEIQSICQQVVNQVLLQGRRRVTLEDVVRVHEAQHLSYRQFLADVESNVKAVFLWAEHQSGVLEVELNMQVEELLTWLRESLIDRLTDLQRQQATQK